MKGISRSTLRFYRSCYDACIASGQSRWFAQGLLQRAPLNQAKSALPEKLLRRCLPRFYEPLNFYHGTGLRSEKILVKLDTSQVRLDRSQVKLDQATEGMGTKETREENNDALDIEDKENREEINDVLDRKDPDTDYVWPRVWHANVYENSSHRDGAIYKEDVYWREYRMNIADHNETVSEVQSPSKGKPCSPDQECCLIHQPSPVLQIFSLSLAKIPINSSSKQLYGYMAARDDEDGLLNYVFNRSRDNPINVEQGSLIEMTGPKRSILMLSDVLIEFDMRFKTGETAEDDLQLIDGLVHLGPQISMIPFPLHFSGSCGGAVDMFLTYMDFAMEAIIEVVTSEVQRTFELSFSSLISITEEPTEFQLFHGAIGELGIKRYVVAIPAHTVMYLKFKVGETVHYCSINSNQHGCVSRQIKLEPACILVKVTVLNPWL